MTYSYLESNIINKNATQLIITLSNYTMYKFKMKKFYNVESNINGNNIMYSFINAIKNRIIIDLRIRGISVFRDNWDPGGQQHLLNYNDNKVIAWKF